MSSDESPPEAPAKRRPAKPTPVRALDDASAKRSQEPAPPPETVHFQVEQRTWVAEAMGQAEGAGGVGILLVRFTLEGAAADPPTRVPPPSRQASEEGLEAWVVGQSLTEVPEASLMEALARAEPWKGSTMDAPFFLEEGGRRGR